MKKSILNLGQALNREEQKEVFGGYAPANGTVAGIWGRSSTGQPGGKGSGGVLPGGECSTDDDCCHYQHNTGTGYVCSGGVCAPGLSPNPFCDL